MVKTIALVGFLLMCVITKGEYNSIKASIQVVRECPTDYKPVTIKSYCIPSDVEYISYIHEDTFAPICGDVPCPPKEGDCPSDFSEGQIGAACVLLPCGGPGERECPAAALEPPEMEISKTVQVILIYKTPIETASECPSDKVPRKIKKYCVPTNVTVTHLQESFYDYVPLCGDAPCPAKQGDCPLDYLDGHIQAVCACGGPGEPTCVTPVDVRGPGEGEIARNVLVTLVG